MTGKDLSHADLTWFPTAIFMEYMLPRVFNWPNLFHESTHFPKLTKWFENLQEDDTFAKVHSEIYSHWPKADKAGQFDSIRELVSSNKDHKWKYP